MPKGHLEHANISVTDPERSAALLIDLLGWHERWKGDAMSGGRTIHVGTDDAYALIERASKSASPEIRSICSRILRRRKIERPLS